MISIIAAIGQNNELGKDNHLLWDLKEDLKFFKETTMNQIIVMGYNTFLSLGRVLPHRTHIILSFQDRDVPSEVLLFHSVEEVLSYIKDKDVFVIGGASIYKQFIDKAERLYLTEIQDSKDADVFFPDFDKKQYTRTLLKSKQENGIDYDHVLYERKSL